MTFPKHALDKLDNSLFQHYPAPTHVAHGDAKIDTVKLQSLLTEFGLTTLVDYDKVVLAYYYPGIHADKRTCAQLGIVTDTAYLHVNVGHEPFRDVLFERWPLIMDQATFHQYPGHSNNPNPPMTWPSVQAKFYLSHVGHRELRWTNDKDDANLQVVLRREEPVHFTEIDIFLTTVSEETAE